MLYLQKQKCLTNKYVYTVLIKKSPIGDFFMQNTTKTLQNYHFAYFFRHFA